MEGSNAGKRRKTGYVKVGAAKGRRRTYARARAALPRARVLGALPRSSISRRRALAIANTRTAGFLGLEKKFYDTALNYTALAAATDSTGGEQDPSATSMISTPAQGDGEQNRDGKRIVIKSVQLAGLISTAESELLSGPPGPLQVFLALVQDTQTNGAQMNSEDCFKNVAAGVYGQVTPLRNLLYASRFKVLKSQVFDVTPTSLSHVAIDSFSVCGAGASFNWYIPCEIPVNFNSGTTSSVANVIDNSLHVIAWCTATAPINPRITYNARIRFMG